MNIFFMLFSFLIIAGLAVIFMLLMNLGIGEGFILSACWIIFTMNLSGNMWKYSYGSLYLCVFCILGCIVAVAYTLLRGQKENFKKILSPYFVFLFGIFCISMLLFYKGEVHNVEEFRQWAVIPRALFQADSMDLSKYASSVIGKHNGSSMFHLFFLERNGYSEPVLYVSSFLLSAIGLLLPIDRCSWKEWRKALIYTLVVYASIFSLFSFGSYNLYPQLPIAAWAGGILGRYLVSKEYKIQNLIPLIIGMLGIYSFTDDLGVWIDLIMVGFIIISVLSYFISRRHQHQKKKEEETQKFTSDFAKKLICRILAAVMILVSIFKIWWVYAQTAMKTSALWDEVLDQVSDKEMALEKINLTSSAFLSKVFGSPLSSVSKLQVGFVPCIIFIILINFMNHRQKSQKESIILHTVYFIFCGVMYCTQLYYLYITNSSYQESVTVYELDVYLSVLVIPLFLYVLSDTIFHVERKQDKQLSEKKSLWSAFGLNPVAITLLFVAFYGWNGNFVANCTSWSNDKIKEYTNISEVKEQAQEINKLLKEKKIYIVNQGSSDDRIEDTAYYYLGSKVNNSLKTPWMFTEDGAMIGADNVPYIDIADLPDYLEDYSYLWIYKTDKYFTSGLKDLLASDDGIKIRDQQVYRIVKNNKDGLKLQKVYDFIENEEIEKINERVKNGTLTKKEATKEKNKIEEERGKTYSIKSKKTKSKLKKSK